MTAARIGSLFVLVALAWTPTRAMAQEDGKPDFAAAKRHFKSGQAFMQMERWGPAVEEFKQAYNITKDGLVMGQVAQAYEKAGDYEGALEAYKVYRDSLPEGERTSAEALIKKCEKLIAEGKSKKLVLPSEAQPKPAVGEESGEGTTPKKDDDAEEGRSSRLYTWIAAGAAGALALSALVVGLNAQSKYDELSDTCKPACADSEVDSVKTRAIVTDVLWGTAAAAAVAAAVLYFVEGRSLKKEKTYEPSDEEEDFVQRLKISPVMGGGTYGVGANLSF